MWSYSGNPASSDLDQVRFWIQDTDETEQLLPDEEITFLVSLWFPIYQSLIYVSAVACEVIASRFAREIASSADGVNVSGDQLQDKYNALAQSLRDQYKAYANLQGLGPDVGGILYAETYDSSIKPLVWAIGMHDNPRAAGQDRGGSYPWPPPDYWGAPGESSP